MLRAPFLAIALVIAATGTVAAQPPPSEAERWYGWQILIADALGGGIAVVGAATDTERLIPIGVLAGSLGAAIIHGRHGNGGRAVASMALLRPGLALGGSLVALLYCTGGDVDFTRPAEDTDACTQGNYRGFFAATWIVASVVDSGMGIESVSVTPLVTPEGARGVALSGTF